MQENQELETVESNGSVNYLLSIILAPLGGLAGVLIWLAPVYFLEYVLYITVIFVGVMAAFGAKTFNPRNGGIIIALIAVIATIIAVIIGDLAETWIIAPNFEITFDTYFDYLDLKFGDDPEQLVYYFVSVVIAGISGFMKNNK